MRKAFEDIGLGAVDVEEKSYERIMKTMDSEDFDPFTEELNANISDVLDLMSQGYFQRESAFRDMRRSAS